MRMNQAAKCCLQVRIFALTNTVSIGTVRACAAFFAVSILVFAPMNADALTENEIRTKAKNFASAAGTLSTDLGTLHAAKTSKTFKRVLDSLDRFSRLSPALGFIGAGIDIAGLFGPPKTDPTLKKLGELDMKLNDLWKDIKASLGRLQDQGDFTALRTALIEDKSVIGAR